MCALRWCAWFRVCLLKFTEVNTLEASTLNTLEANSNNTLEKAEHTGSKLLPVCSACFQWQCINIQCTGFRGNSLNLLPVWSMCLHMLQVHVLTSLSSNCFQSVQLASTVSVFSVLALGVFFELASSVFSFLPVCSVHLLQSSLNFLPMCSTCFQCTTSFQCVQLQYTCFQLDTDAWA